MVECETFGILVLREDEDFVRFSVATFVKLDFCCALVVGTSANTVLCLRHE